VFEQNREEQYTRKLLFSTVVDLMALVALGLQPSLHAAAQASGGLGVSLTALYDKVNHTEPQVVRDLVRGSAQRLGPVVKFMKEKKKGFLYVEWAGLRARGGYRRNMGLEGLARPCGGTGQESPRELKA
jgi:hypothetical protein